MRLYLIGAGHIAGTHALAAAKLDELVELRVADPHPAVLDGFLQAHPDAVAFPDAEEMLASEEPRDDDIVIVATPPFAHRANAVAALASGRHVLCEKPLAMDADEAEHVLAAARSHARLLGSCSTRFRGLPHTEAVKSVLADGRLGEPAHLEFVTRFGRSRAGIEYQPGSRWFLDASKSGGGVLMDWGPYDFSTIFDLLEPVRVDVLAAWTGRAETGADPDDTVFDVETEVGATLRVHRPAGPPVQVTYGRASATQATERGHAELSGSRGAVHWTPFDSRAPVRVRTDEGGAVVEREAAIPERSPLEIFDRPLAEFHAAVRGRPSLAAVNEAAVDEFRCLRAIYDVARSGEPASVEVRS